VQGETVFAWTQPSGNVPGYIHIELNPLFEYEITVRTAAQHSTSVTIMPRAELETLVRHLAKHLGLKVS
jgi:hypothetical protein